MWKSQELAKDADLNIPLHLIIQNYSWDIYILIWLCPIHNVFFLYMRTRATLNVWHIGTLCGIINCGLKKVRLRENRLTLGATWVRPDGGRGPRHRPVTSGDETRRLKRSSMEIGAVAPSSVNGCPFLDQAGDQSGPHTLQESGIQLRRWGDQLMLWKWVLTTLQHISQVIMKLFSPAGSLNCL